jgi:diguanylate cyclase (GGDEF)-like protein
MQLEWDPDAIDEDEGECTMVASRSELMAAAQPVRREPPRPYLVILSGTTAGRMLPVGKTTVIGRHGSCDVVIELEGVSRRHAQIELLPDGSAEVADLGSKNGTFVNGEPVTRCTLRDGDRIQVGPVTLLKFSYRDAVDETLQQNLYDSATRDALTRAYNKRYFAEALPREISFAERHKRSLALVLFDVDHFKRINDGYGHPAGDAVLQKLASTVSSALRNEDVLARYGGEEFALILRDLDEDRACICAERVRARVMATEFTFEQKIIPVTISLGVATLGPNARTPDAMVAAADARLYAAKRGGRNRVEPSR